ncbi:diguanylate cyclase/phosphodiesterase [Clostridium sp. CAG:465]|nr:diguanylate cyclase/phosphodiesterase [Clostridium sp. CAG:465]
MWNFLTNPTFLKIAEIFLLVILGFVLYQLINYRKIRKREIEKKQAYTDQLTGRGNRYLFLSVLDKLIKKGNKFAVCFMDLDGFKQINDTMGHDAGDELLVYLARTFDEKLPSNAVAYRLGGDEFSIVIQNIKTTRDITKVLDYMKKQLEEPIMIQGTSISLQYSLGISVFPEDAKTKTELIMYADDAMYYIKENGKNGYYFHNKSLKAKLDNKNKMEKDLKEAYDKNEFSISLQPRINLNDMDNICFEALLYWNHPVLGKLDSDYFIKQADEMGIIVKLDRFVLENMCKKLTELKNNGYTNIQMAVNISTRHFMKDDFTNELCKILEKYNVSKGEVILELTNNIDLKKINMYRSMFEKLKKSGAKISINNFNIKYEDMILYNNLNIDEIKLYAKYISKESDLNDNCLENVIKLSKDLESEITICCIETKEQLEKAIKYGADKVQGFFLFNKMYDEYISDVIKKYDNLKEKVYKVISDVK